VFYPLKDRKRLKVILNIYGMEEEFKEFIEKLKEEIQEKIKEETSRLSYVEKMLFSSFMPLSINLDTDKGNVTFVINKDLNVSLENLVNTDISIKGDFKIIKEIFESRNKEEFKVKEKEGKIKIIPNTMKGRLAEGKLRELLGK